MMKNLLFWLMIILSVCVYAQELDTTYFVNEDGKTIGLVHEKGEVPLYNVQQTAKTKSLKGKQDSHNKSNVTVEYDSSSYYQNVINHNLSLGNRNQFTGTLLAVLGIAGVVTGTALIVHYNVSDDESDGELFAGEITAGIGAPIFLAGIIFRARGMSRLKRAEQYENMFNSYKNRKRMTLDLSMVPKIDVAHQVFGGNLVMSF